MTKITFRNQFADGVELVIEPWATSADVGPGEIVEFEVSDAPPAEIEFAMLDDGRPYVFVLSESVRIRGAGIEQDFKVDKRPEGLSIFTRILNQRD